MANEHDPQTIPELVAQAAKRFAAREGVVDEDVRFDFAELGLRVDEAAKAAISAGLLPGDRVAIWAPNCWEWIVAALGVVSAGCVLVPINTRFKGREAGYVIQRSGARMLFTVRGFLGFDYPEMLHEAHGPVHNGRPVEELESLERIVLLRGDPIRGTEPFGAFMHDSEHATDEELRFRTDALKPGDLSDIIFTSGTTGKPKGVMTTHEQTLRVFQVWSRAVGLARGRPLPDRQPVLPHLRVQGRDPRVPDARRDDRPARGLRRADRARADRGREGHGVAGPADAVPVDPEPPRPRRRSTCLRCASR